MLSPILFLLKLLRAAQTIAVLWDVGMGEGDDMGPGRNRRRPGEPIPCMPGSAPSALGLVPTPPTNDGHPILGGDSRPASDPLDDVYQPRITPGIGGWG